MPGGVYSAGINEIDLALVRAWTRCAQLPMRGTRAARERRSCRWRVEGALALHPQEGDHFIGWRSWGVGRG
jgi:hypothetical protein